jgi:GGDEF domain-containing protein
MASPNDICFRGRRQDWPYRGVARFFPEQLILSALDTFARPILLIDRLVRASVSIGIATLQADRRTPRELLSAADLALYAAKAKARPDGLSSMPEWPPAPTSASSWRLPCGWLSNGKSWSCTISR